MESVEEGSFDSYHEETGGYHEDPAGGYLNDSLGGYHEDAAAYHELSVVLNDHVHQLYTTAVTFDSHEQLFWAGSQSGRLSSYYGAALEKYTAFKAHHDEIYDLLTDAHGILSLASNEVRYTTKQGLKIFASSEENMHSMRNLLRGTGHGDNYVLIAGKNDHFYELDLTSGHVYQKMQIGEANTIKIKQSSHYICGANTHGQISLYDPDRLELCQVLDAHTASVLDFDVNGNTLVTCGLSSRYGHHLTPDTQLMAFDLRTLRSFPPIHVPIEPAFVRFMPTYTLRCLIVSQRGEFMFCQPDSVTLEKYLYEINNQNMPITSCCVSSTFKGLGFGDAAGFIHLWAESGENQSLFNHVNQETLTVNQKEPAMAFDIDDWSVSLTSIAMPECSEPLLSDWPEHLIGRADRPTPPIDPDILANVTVRQFVGYAPNPKTRLRNEVAYNLGLDGKSTYKYPESPMDRDASNCGVPKIYRKVEIKYSKYGVEDFNFKHYNQTPFSGLEIHIPNAYCNSMIQVLYFIEAVHAKIQNHLCQREFCVACELGFLFYMLDVADGTTCQASNFLRTFRTLPEASALDLLLNETVAVNTNRNLAQTAQNWNRFVLRQLHQDTSKSSGNCQKVAKKCEKGEIVKSKAKENEKDEKEIEEENDEEKPLRQNEKKVGINEPEVKEPKFEEASDVKELFGMDIIKYRKCKCGSVYENKSTLFTIDLSYPDLKECESNEEHPFTALLTESIARKQTTQAWCDKCRKYQNSSQHRKIVSLPDVLSVNLHIDNAKEVNFWTKQQQLCQPALTQPTPTNQQHTFSPPKHCRYGRFCNRAQCKFVHHGRDANTPPGGEEEGPGDSGKYWVPSVIRVHHDHEIQQVNIARGDQEASDDDNSENEGTVYRLMSNVCHIHDASFGSTLVGHIRVPKQYHLHKQGEEREHWYLFNDFAITPVREVDAVTFNMTWKVPCILTYVRQDIASRHEMKIESQLDNSILFAEKSLAMRQCRFSRNFTPLNSTEVLKEGDIVGVDAEFVTLNQEESEMRRDGTLSTLRPSQMSVARVTVVRGWGILCGVPFIDDYISTSEQVVDYLTKFSGIKPGDLDATSSSKHLTTLKMSYLKLRYLIDRKVTFIGHGLKKDFRVINLVIPKEQVVDTVELFHIPRQRYVSLKFLAWHFLNIKIQEDTHDSAEDAYTALKLYDKYQELSRAGEWVLEEELEILYDTGRQHNWQVPE